MRRCILPAVLLILALIPVSAPAVSVQVSVREIFEENVNPLLSGAGRRFSPATGRMLPIGAAQSGNDLSQAAPAGTRGSDFYTLISAGVGESAGIGVGTEVSLKAEISRYQYRTFEELNATRAALFFSSFLQFSDIHALRFGFSQARIDYRAGILNSRAYAGNLDFLQQLSTRFCLREGFSYGKSRSGAPAYSYTERSLAAGGDYRASARTSAGFGYSCALRKHDDGDRTILHSLEAKASMDMTPWMQVSLSLERQYYRRSGTGSRGRNTISAAGVAFSF